MTLSPYVMLLYALPMHLSFPQGGAANEQIALRWLHIIAGIIWIGLLYFFNLIGFPTMRRLDGPVRVKVIAEMMPRAMWWFRWSALVTVVMGLRYFWVLLASDARNAGDPSLGVSLVRGVAARLAGGLRADLSVSAARERRAE